MDPTAVYLMRNIFSESNYKIGVSSIPYRRVWQVEESYGVGPVIATTVWFPTRYAATKAEALWHQYLHQYQTDDHGGKEWFCLPEAIVKEFLHWAKESPDGVMLKLKAKAQKLSQAEVRRISTQLLRSIPNERTTRTADRPTQAVCKGDPKRTPRSKRRRDELPRDSRSKPPNR